MVKIYEVDERVANQNSSVSTRLFLRCPGETRRQYNNQRGDAEAAEKTERKTKRRNNRGAGHDRGESKKQETAEGKAGETKRNRFLAERGGGELGASPLRFGHRCKSVRTTTAVNPAATNG